MAKSESNIKLSNKTGILEFAKELSKFGVEILSTGGTAKSLREAGITLKVFLNIPDSRDA